MTLAAEEAHGYFVTDKFTPAPAAKTRSAHTDHRLSTSPRVGQVYPRRPHQCLQRHLLCSFGD
jgi:hypothetical protein